MKETTIFTWWTGEFYLWPWVGRQDFDVWGVEAVMIYWLCFSWEIIKQRDL